MQPTRRSVLTAGALGTLGAFALTASPSASAASFGGPATSALAKPANSCTLDPHHAKRQLRGLWIASVVNIDWPSKPGLSPAQQQAELVAYLDLAVSRNLTSVVLQVRPTADAFFKSDLEPWSAYLTGTQGKDPGYDPLAFAVEQCHARGLELHAWCNPFRVTMNLTTDLTSMASNNVAKTHPEWTVPYGGKLYLNPGIPQARAHIEAAIMQIVTKYDVDAIHFDDYFYPYPVAGQTFADSAQYAQYGAGMSLADWRRSNCTALMRSLGAQIKAAKPAVKFGVSPFGVWRNASTDPVNGSATQAGSQTYDDLYADTRMWARTGVIDYLAPQVYWAIGLAVADYAVLVKWWSEQLAGAPCALYIGEATYKVGASTQSWAWNNDPNELSNHLALDATLPTIAGNIWYNAGTFRANALDATGIVARTWYARPSLVPTMPWLRDTRAPKAPKTVQARRSGAGVTLSMRPGDDSTWQFVIYRVPLAEVGHGKVKPEDCALADATNLVARVVATGGTQTWTDPSAEAGTAYTYVVTGVDRLWQESHTSQVTVR